MPDDVATAAVLRELRRPVTTERHQQVSLQAECEGLSITQYLRVLAEQEAEGKRQRRVERLLKASGLPPDKTRATLQFEQSGRFGTAHPRSAL